MKNRGFTLVELLGVITLMALLSLAAFELLDTVNKENKEKAEEVQIKEILDAAIAYVPTSDILLPDVEDAYPYKGGKTYCKGTSVSPKQYLQLPYTSIDSSKIEVQNMKNAGYTKLCETTLTLNYLVEIGQLEKIPNNPITGKPYNGNSKIRIFLISDSKTAEKDLAEYIKEVNPSSSKMEKPWKYDGNYLYLFQFE